MLKAKWCAEGAGTCRLCVVKSDFQVVCCIPIGKRGGVNGGQ